MKHVWTAMTVALLVLAVANGIAFITPNGDSMNGVAAVLCAVAAFLSGEARHE